MTIDSDTGLTPDVLLLELNNYVVGQTEAKEALVGALRSRYRRSKLPPEWREAISPNHMLLVGPTGSGKTLLVDRLARRVDAPVYKTDATSYTTVGYVGKSVSDMIDGLLHNTERFLKKKYQEDHESEAVLHAIDKLTKDIVNEYAKPTTPRKYSIEFGKFVLNDSSKRTISNKLHKELSDNYESYSDIKISYTKKKKKKSKNLDIIFIDLNDDTIVQDGAVHDALNHHVAKYMESKLADIENAEVIKYAEEHGIIFVDEFDKLATGPKDQKSVENYGVQRDLLTILSGTEVKTKYGEVNTSQMLFIMSGAFKVNRIEDLIGEMVRRLPIVVRLVPLTYSDYRSILVDIKYPLLQQYQKLFSIDNVDINFSDKAIDVIANQAVELNKSDDMGASRLQNIMERVIRPLRNLMAKDDISLVVNITEDMVSDIIVNDDYAKLKKEIVESVNI